MILAVVKGNVVSTNKTEKLLGGKLLIVEEWNIDTRKYSGLPRVALDLVGAGEGELVMCVSGSSARQTEQTDKRPVDMAIVGIVDQGEMDGATCYKKYPSEETEGDGSGSTSAQADRSAKAADGRPAGGADKGPGRRPAAAPAQAPAEPPIEETVVKTGKRTYRKTVRKTQETEH